jgi:hypothetical protein
VYRAEELTQVLDADDIFTLPSLLGDLQVPVRTFLE